MLASPYSLMLLGMKVLLSGLAGVDVVGETQTWARVLALVDCIRPDLLVADLHPALGAYEGCISLLRTKHPSIRVVLLLDEGDHGAHMQKKRGDGANLLLDRDKAGDQLLPALRILSGAPLGVSRTSTAKATERERGILRLVPLGASRTDAAKATERERGILRLVAEGNTNSQIAERLGISAHTVRTHRWNAMRKLGLHNGADIAMYAMNQGLLASDDPSEPFR